MGERRNSTRIANIMRDFSNWIEDMEVPDPHLYGGRFTWFRGGNHSSAARLDKFLLFMEREESFTYIR